MCHVCQAQASPGHQFMAIRLNSGSRKGGRRAIAARGKVLRMYVRRPATERHSEGAAR
jgi:hypothetical protein